LLAWFCILKLFPSFLKPYLLLGFSGSRVFALPIAQICEVLGSGLLRLANVVQINKAAIDMAAVNRQLPRLAAVIIANIALAEVSSIGFSSSFKG
jgi:hypothetical protein